MALTFIGQSVTSAIINNLIDTWSSYLKACPAASGMQDELARLHFALPQVQAVLTAVEECAPAMMENEGLRMWLWQLRDAMENAEDVLDELDYYKLEKTIQDRDDKVRDEMVIGLSSKFKKITFDRFFNRKFSDDTLKRLREAVEGLVSVVAGIGPFLQLAVGFYGPRVKRQKLEEVKNARETSCLLVNEVFGRDKERDTIVEWLIKPVDGESEGITFNVSAYTIVGMGGLGKTTLAQLIYHDKRVQGYFDPIIWVCVSQDFNAAGIIRKMLEVENSGKSLNALHEDLKQKLTSNRFLLILDDVWNEDNMLEWEKLVAPLKFGERGSKILLTTRMASVVDMAARAMQCKNESLNLNKLEENDYMSLFNKHAFFNVNPDDHKNLQPIGKQIAKKLGGCPLAIKVMGGLLNSCLDYDSWKRILEKRIFGKDTMIVQQRENCIREVLKLSYDHLPIHLQVYFRYCSIFPQDYEFKRKELVEMWIGSGQIPQSICEGQRSPEDIGKEFFDLLTKKSFFTCKTTNMPQFSKYYYLQKLSKYYVIHDLLHDLAQSVSQDECIRIRGDVAGNIIPETVRHLSLENINYINFPSIGAISKLKNLRTLIISATDIYGHNADHLNEVIKGFKNLRLLRLKVDFCFYKLPDKLDSLVHLRYLSLSGRVNMNENFLDFFRSTLCRLYHLEFLEFNIEGKIYDIIESNGLANLVSLRSFVPSYVTKKIPFVGKLTSIRKLEDFFVQEKCGYKISELNDLRELRRLSITGLENVRTSEEAMEVKLKDKNYLKSLSLQWSRDRSNRAEADEKLLDNLCPNTNLEKLNITGYQGVKSPCWMTNLSLVNLTSIVLMGCKGWEHLPPLGCLQSLKGIIFEEMPNLKEWIGIDDCCMFPKLHTMRIIDCPNLSGLPTLPCSLRFLYISNVGLTALPAIDENCGNNNQEQFLALETLTIEGCEKLQYLPTELFQKFNTLKVLRIENCPKWTIRGISNIQQPYILDEGTIGSCGDLEVLLLCSANLTSLTISGLHGVKKIDSSFFGSSRGCAFPSLKDLIFDNLPNLEEWIGIDDGCMFPKLDTMKIINCPILSRLPALPQCLNKLHIKDVGLSTLLAIENCGNNNQQEQFLALETLTIEQCKKLQYLPTELFQKFNTLKALSIKYCPKLTVRGISYIEQPSILDEGTIGSCGDLEVLLLCLVNLTSLTISGLHGVKKIDFSFFGSSRGCAFPSLEKLVFMDLPNLEEWIGMDDCCMFPKLRTMTITRCPNLSILPTLPCSLRKLHISNVGLTAPPAIEENCGNNNQQEYFQDLKKLTIEQCDKLEYIPTEFCQKFNTVKSPIIKKWPKLITRRISDIRLPSILKKLTIESCGDLEVHLLRFLPNLTSLIKLELVDYASITSLPPTQVCARWTMLSRLEIKNCKELSSFGGIQALVSLHWLKIRGCDKLIEVSLRQPPFTNDVGQRNAVDCFLKLGKLSIDHHALLLMEPLRSLSSISSFTLTGASRFTSLPQEWLLQNHSALKELDIWNACSLQSLPQSMTQLCSLESLVVGNAKLIQSLPDLPTSLRDLWISGCHPALKERCQENIGLDWPKIANILDVEIE